MIDIIYALLHALRQKAWDTGYADVVPKVQEHLLMIFFCSCYSYIGMVGGKDGWEVDHPDTIAQDLSLKRGTFCMDVSLIFISFEQERFALEETHSSIMESANSGEIKDLSMDYLH